MGGEGGVVVEDQTGKFVLLSNDKIDTMNNYGFCDQIFHIGIE